MALVTTEPARYFFPGFVVTYTITYDDVTNAITQVNVSNPGPNDATVTARHPTTGNAVSSSIPAGANRTFALPANAFTVGRDTGPAGTPANLTFYPQGL